MKLQEHLVAYRTTSLQTATRERAFWTVGGAFLFICTVLLLFDLAFFDSVLTDSASGAWRKEVAPIVLIRALIATGVSALASAVGLFWLGAWHHLRKEITQGRDLARRLWEEISRSAATAYQVDSTAGEAPDDIAQDAHMIQDEGGPTTGLSFLGALMGLMSVLLPVAWVVAFVVLMIAPWVALR